MKNINASRILRTIYLNKGISRIEISRILGLDKSTITNVVSDFLAQGLVKITAEGKASILGGRKPEKLSINKDYGYVVGFELQPESYTAVTVNLDGEILFSRSKEITISGSNLVSVFFELLESIRKEMKKSGLPIIGIGVGLPGNINPYEGIIYQSIPLNITNRLDFFPEVSHKLDISVFVENDANCCSWGELAFHKREQLKNFIFVLVEFRHGDVLHSLYGSIAAGMGIVLNGKVHYGESFTAGEFKSLFWKPPNKGQFSLTDEELLRVEKDRELFIRFTRELSMNIALLVNTFNLSHVFLGGSIEKFQSDIIPILREEIQKNWSYPNEVKCAIRFSSFGDRAVAYGAAGMFLERVFAHPEVPQNDVGLRWGGIDLLPDLRG
jgi:predicted NBD/HSP70 family sugar kinase